MMKKLVLVSVIALGLFSSLFIGKTSYATEVSEQDRETSIQDQITIDSVKSGLQHVSGTAISTPWISYSVYVNGRYVSQAGTRYIDGKLKYSTSYVNISGKNGPIALSVGDKVTVEAYSGDGFYVEKNIYSTVETIVEQGVIQPDKIPSETFSVNPVAADSAVHISGTKHPNASYYRILVNGKYVGRASNRASDYSTNSQFNGPISLKIGDRITVEAVSGDGFHIPIKIYSTVETIAQ
ncbi:hypothetical protein IGJ34_002940 [Enterococcus sp. AZ177]